MQQQQLDSLAASSGAKEPGTVRRAGGQRAFFEVPSFYATSGGGGDAAVDANSSERRRPDRGEQQWIARGSTGSGGGDAADGAPRRGRLLRNKCLSLLALVAAVAALGCSLASLAGTTSWVDTWEPIDLPPLDDWPALFGTGYGSRAPGRAKEKPSGGGGGKSSAYGKLPSEPSKSSGAEHHEQQPSHPHHVANVTPMASAPPTPPTASFVTARPTTAPPRRADSDEDDDEDEFDYQYAQDQGYHVDVPDAAQSAERADADGAEQRDEERRRSLVVLFHVGLFRACPSLKGELPANIVLPNLPCVPLEYVNWRPLSAQSFRLWRSIEFTPDFLNKLRYATPCFLLGTAISFIALAVAATGRCSLADRTLVVSSLHILAGLSLGSGLIVFVSVLHEEFSPPTLRSPRYGSGAAGWLPGPAPRAGYGAIYSDGAASSAVAFYPDGRTLATTISSGSSPGHQAAAGGVGGVGVGGSGLVSAVPVPSFRYGWSFYAALAAFVSSELAAALYIVLHSHVAKWMQRQRANGQQASAANLKTSLPSFDLSMAPVPCKEIGVQTSPLSSASLLTMMDNHGPVGPCVPLPVAGQVAMPPIDVTQQIPYCDLIAMEPPCHALQTSRHEIVMAPYAPEGGAHGGVAMPPPCSSLNQYVNPGTANESDCTCQIHYATYRPKARNAGHVAGIHKASTMPRKVAFAGDQVNVYQQTPL